ncbi:Glycosyltransferase involved in cell wall biosynthesis [Bordetella tumulicola]
MAPLSRILHRFKPSSRGQAIWPQNTVSRWLVLQQNNNPSTDYYIRSRLEETGLPVSYKDLDQDTPHFGDLAPGTGVVIVRYLNARWVAALRTHRSQLSYVAYFMDDDLLHPKHWAGLPRSYIKKLQKYCGAFIPDIRALASAYWFSTQTLQDRYQFKVMQVIPPRPLPLGVDNTPLPLRPLDVQSPVQMFYHGSATHQAELDWLHPIVERLLYQCPDLHFEVIGNHAVNLQFRDLPRTRVLHPMSWHSYISHCQTINGHIGLAPLLPSSFNEGRSHSKIYDITRCGAIGVYSTPSAYTNAIVHGEDGLLLKNEPDLWVQTIAELVENRARLNALRTAAHARHSTPVIETPTLMQTLLTAA